MCHAAVELTQKYGTFTMDELHAHMNVTGYAARGNNSARLLRLVRNEVVKVANETEARNGKVARYQATDAITPYMRGDRGAYLAAKDCAPQPELCKVWGINMPPGFYSRRYPHARVHKQSWN